MRVRSKGRWLLVLAATSVLAAAGVVAFRDGPKKPIAAEAPTREPESEPAPVAAPEPPPEREREAEKVAAAKPAAAPQPRDVRDEPDREGLAESLHAPIIKAVRARYPSELARRDAMVDALESSGASRESWTRDAKGVFDKWRFDAATDTGRVDVDTTRCFRAGCETIATFPDSASYRAAEERTASLDLGWKGAWMQTPPEPLPSGEVHVTWFLLRPDAL